GAAVAISALRAPARPPSTDAPEAAPRTPGGVDDVLVFERAESGFSLVGGAGRGAGWAGIVDLEPDDDSLVSRAWETGGQIRMANDSATQVCGPYYARFAVAVPVGESHVVVFGSREPIRGQDSDLVRAAATVVDRLD